MDLRKKLDSMGLVLPAAGGAVADYVPAVESPGDGLVVVSGQLPMADGSLTAVGRVGEAVSVEAAQEAAGLCVLNGLAAVDRLIGGRWQRLRRVLRVGVFVASGEGFTEQHVVANGASGVLVGVFGEAMGRQARAAVGVSRLPLDAAVEVEMLLKLEPPAREQDPD